jgi:prevent-host-death family protein
MPHREWKFQDAKARLSEVGRLAASEGPQVITVHGRPKFVLVDHDAFFASDIEPKVPVYKPLEEYLDANEGMPEPKGWDPSILNNRPRHPEPMTMAEVMEWCRKNAEGLDIDTSMFDVGFDPSAPSSDDAPFPDQPDTRPFSAADGP